MRVLHVLAPAEPETDKRLIPADCGHECTASEQTHDLLATPNEHVIYCLPCYMREAAL